MKRIFAIGGGEISELETIEIDREIIKATGKVSPKVLFIPTASQDSLEYIEAFNHLYGSELGCQIDCLKLFEDNITSEEARERILSSDIVYVGGGNTKMMMDTWSFYHIDEHLKEAYEQEIVLCGLSAGAICWFTRGQSDTQQYEPGNLNNFIVVDGLGIIDAVVCPHYNEITRDVDFNFRVERTTGVGIALDNNAAIEFKGDLFKSHTTTPEAHVYKIYNSGQGVVKEVLKSTDGYKSVVELLKQ